MGKRIVEHAARFAVPLEPPLGARKFLQRARVPSEEFTLDDGSGLSKENRISPAAITVGAVLRAARAASYGFGRSEILAGNIGYLEIRGFGSWVPEARDSVARIMSTLADASALIIDLRENGGGSPEAVQYVVSHFMEPNRPLVTFHMGGPAEDKQKRAEAWRRVVARTPILRTSIVWEGVDDPVQVVHRTATMPITSTSGGGRCTGPTSGSDVRRAASCRTTSGTASWTA